jgi:hypothetical protein
VEHTSYLIAVEAGLLLGLIVVAGWMLYVRIPKRARRAFQLAARSLGGRVDPASESARYPAILVEFDGLLIRAVLWPIDLDEEQDSRPPFLEICTPVDGIPSPARAIRPSEEAGILPLLRKRRAETWTDAEHATEPALSSPRPSAWAIQALESHPSWVVVELDRGRLRVLTNHPASEPFEAPAITAAIHEFTKSLPEVAVAAGLPQLSHRH